MTGQTERENIMSYMSKNLTDVLNVSTFKQTLLVEEQYRTAGKMPITIEASNSPYEIKCITQPFFSFF